MRTPRRLARLLFLSGSSLVLLPLGLVSRLCALVGAERAALVWGARVQAWWARCMVLGLGIDLAVEGRVPEGTFLVVANHLSYVDIPVLGALFRGRFVAKSEMAGWPVLGQLARVAGTIFVVRARRKDVVRVDREIARTLAADVSVMLFPEGGASRGIRVERLHSSLLESAARARIPCLAVAIHYETPQEPWAPAGSVCWWGGMTFWRHLWTLIGLQGVQARARVAPRPIVVEDRKLLAEGLRRELLARFVPIRQEPLPPDFPWPELFEAGRAPGERAVQGSRTLRPG